MDELKAAHDTLGLPALELGTDGFHTLPYRGVALDVGADAQGVQVRILGPRLHADDEDDIHDVLDGISDEAFTLGERGHGVIGGGVELRGGIRHVLVSLELEPGRAVTPEQLRALYDAAVDLHTSEAVQAADAQFAWVDHGPTALAALHAVLDARGVPDRDRAGWSRFELAGLPMQAGLRREALEVVHHGVQLDADLGRLDDLFLAIGQANAQDAPADGRVTLTAGDHYLCTEGRLPVAAANPTAVESLLDAVVALAGSRGAKTVARDFQRW